MALCTECGVILHIEDAKTHICDPTDIPAKGTQYKFIKETK